MPHGNNINYYWRGAFTNVEIHALHAKAFETRLYDGSEWNWIEQCEQHSLGWVVARDGDQFVGFVNVLWDGLVHAFIEDVMVAADSMTSYALTIPATALRTGRNRLEFTRERPEE